jgi:hypothetical protein
VEVRRRVRGDATAGTQSSSKTVDFPQPNKLLSEHNERKPEMFLGGRKQAESLVTQLLMSVRAQWIWMQPGFVL